MFGNGVDETAHLHHRYAEEDRCPAKVGDVCGQGAVLSTQAAAASGGHLEYPVEGSFLAVGPNGTVYLGQRNRVKAFTPAGIYLSQVVFAPEPELANDRELGGVSGLAINASDDLYVIRNGIVGVNEYTPSGKLLRTLEQGDQPAGPEGPTPALALDPAGNVFLDVHTPKEHRMDEFDADGVRLASFDAGQPDALHGIAYDPFSRKLYAVSTNNNVTPVLARVRIITPTQP